MQSVVLDARMQESLAKAATSAGGNTATRALASSAHFLCSGSETVHHRIFFAVTKDQFTHTLLHHLPGGTVLVSPYSNKRQFDINLPVLYY